MLPMLALKAWLKVCAPAECVPCQATCHTAAPPPSATPSTAHHGLRQAAQQLRLVHGGYCDLIECAVCLLLLLQSFAALKALAKLERERLRATSAHSQQAGGVGGSSMRS